MVGDSAGDSLQNRLRAQVPSRYDAWAARMRTFLGRVGGLLVASPDQQKGPTRLVAAHAVHGLGAGFGPQAWSALKL